MSRAINLRLQPSDAAAVGTTVSVYTYLAAERIYRSMAESVYLDMELQRCRFGIELTPDEARVLANQLLQVADVADEHRAARVADDELQASFDEISQELQEAEERGGTGCYYVHPDVHYVPEAEVEVEAKVRELSAAGVKRFMVLIEPSFGAAA